MEGKVKDALKRAQLVTTLLLARKIILEDEYREIKGRKRVNHQYNDVVQRRIPYCQEINDKHARRNTSLSRLSLFY